MRAYTKTNRMTKKKCAFFVEFVLMIPIYFLKVWPFGAIGVHQRRLAVPKISIGVVSAIGVNNVQKTMTFVWKWLNARKVRQIAPLFVSFVRHPLTAFIFFICFSHSASVTITRDCLSTLSGGFRTDLPADRYEGCREASKDVRLGHYVFNNTIKELDIKREHFDSTTFCYCFLDHRCNGSATINPSMWTIAAAVLCTIFILQRSFLSR